MAGISTQKPGNVVEDVGVRSAAEELVGRGYSRCRHNVPLTGTTGTSVDLHAVHDAYKESYNDLCNYAFSITHSLEPAQDCVHQAFTGTLATVKSGGQIEDLKHFLTRCVRNNCLIYLRKSKREPVYSFEPDSVLGGEADRGKGNSTAETVEISGRWKKVKSAVDNLPPSQRFALLMAEFEGFSYDEIADRMNRSNNSVRQLICRAREKVRSATHGGSDWATIPAPAIEIDRMLAQGHMDLSPNVLERIQVKASQLQTWLGNMLQSGVESVVHPVASVATGAAVVALATASPAPPAEPVTGDAGPVAGGFQSAPSLVLQFGNSGGSQSESAARSSVVDLPVKGDDAGMLLRQPRGQGKWNPGASEGDHPALITPGGSQCDGKKPSDRGGCGDGKPDKLGGGKGVTGDDLEDPDGGSDGEGTSVLKKTTLSVSSCTTQKTLSKVSKCSFSVSNKAVKLGATKTLLTGQSLVSKYATEGKFEVMTETAQITTFTVVGEVSENNLTVVEAELSPTLNSEVANVGESGSEGEEDTSGAGPETEISSEMQSIALPGK